MEAPRVANAVTLDDLMALGSDANVEVVNGEIVYMSPVGGLHHIITGNIYRTLDGHVVPNRLGIVFMDGLLYLLKENQQGLRGARVPDVSFVRKERIPKDWNMERPFPGAPDLAVEVVSPGDDVDELLERVRDYLEAGTAQVWVFYPRQKEIHQYRSSTPDIVRVYTGRDQIDVDELFPGLVLIAEDLFALPQLDT